MNITPSVTLSATAFTVILDRINPMEITMIRMNDSMAQNSVLIALDSYKAKPKAIETSNCPWVDVLAIEKHEFLMRTAEGKKQNVKKAN